jgi:hypothetical protein
LTQDEIHHHKDRGGMSVDYDQINVEDREATLDDVKQALDAVGAEMPSDPEIQGFIEGRAVSLPDGNIYMPPDTRSGYGPYGTPEEEYMDVLAGEINHQAQYQGGDPKEVVEQLMDEARMGNAQYYTSGTYEFAAHQPERDAASANQNQTGSRGSGKNH